MRRNLLFALFLLFFAAPALAECTFAFDIHNNSGRRIHVKEAYYKVHKSTWEILNAGSVVDVKTGENSYTPGEPPVVYWVWNAAVGCGQKVRFKFTYNCHNDDSGPQTQHSYLLKGVSTANKTTHYANVRDCHGDVVFGSSRTAAELND